MKEYGKTIRFTVAAPTPANEADAFGRRATVLPTLIQTETWDTMPKSGYKPARTQPLEVGGYRTKKRS